jgi:TRAP-type C4-dicarboxylate transport system permease small subunit
MLKLLKYVNDGITRVMNWLMVTLMSLMVAFIFAQVIFRYVLEKPLSWSEELSGYLFSGCFSSVPFFFTGSPAISICQSWWTQ